MRIRGIRLLDSETFACSRSAIKHLFGEAELDWVSFGSPIRAFRFDNQVAHRPGLMGFVVASVAIDRERRAHMCLYPVARSRYPQAAQEEFSVTILPSLREWLHAKRSQPATATLGHEQIIVEWTDRKHITHELRFL
jgi:hypothetical protein